MKRTLTLLLLILSISVFAQNTNVVIKGVNMNVLQGTNVFVDGSITVDTGSLIDNDGLIELKNNFINNSNGDAFTPVALGRVFLSGDSQTITGTSTTKFNKLVLGGNGNKAITLNTDVRDSLGLNNRVINVNNSRLFLYNTALNSLSRTSGYIHTNTTGKFTRATNLVAAYLYPLGSLAQNKYRPVEITPASNSGNTYEAGLRFNNPTLDGYNAALIDTGMCAINTRFYHVVNRQAGASGFDVTVYYDSLVDGSFSLLSGWNNTIWKNEGADQTTIGALNSVKVLQWPYLFDSEVALADNITKPVLSPSGPISICNGGSTTITAPAGYSAYLWNNGAITQSITVTQSGAYYVQVSRGINCSINSDTVIVNASTVLTPTVTLSSDTVLCPAETVNITSAQTYQSYLWSTGETTNAINIAAQGNYNLTVTDANNCTGTLSSPVHITQVNPVIPSVNPNGNTNFCPGGSVNLTVQGGSFTTYQWSNSSTQNNITVSQNGTYNVTTTDANGCTANDATPVTVSLFTVTAPNVQATGNTNICPGNSVTLNVQGTYNSYLWSNSSTQNSISVNQNGTYNVTATDANGCTATDATPVTVSLFSVTAPNVQAVGNANICPGTSVTLNTGGTYSSYAWNNSSTQTTITVNQSGTYNVTTTDANGCTATDATPLTVNTFTVTPPNVQAAGNTSFCPGGSVVLNVQGNYNSYAWSNSSTQTSITVSQSGTYNVTTTDANGCTSTDATPVTVSAFTVTAPNVQAAGNTSFCPGGSVVLNVQGTYNSYSWSNSSTQTNITVSQSGTYNVTTTDANGCTSTDATPVTVNAFTVTPPNVQAASNTSFCPGGTVVINAGGTFNSYLWSTGGTQSSITVSQNGSYNVTATDANGCTAAGSVPVTVSIFSVTAPVLSPNGTQTICPGSSLVSLATTGYNSYLWSNGTTTNNATLTQNGTYNVTVTDVNGCTSSAASPVTVNFHNITPPTITANGNTSFCPGGSLQLVSSPNYQNYLWSNGNVNDTISITQSGSYNVTATDANGCTTSSANPITVTLLSVTPPVITPSGNQSICPGSTVALQASQGYSSYTWSNNVNQSANTVGVAGSYNVTVTDNNGCSSSAAQPVTVSLFNTVNPQISVSQTSDICPDDSITLSVVNNFSNYQWSNGPVTQTNKVFTSGTYSVVATDVNGCTTSDDTTITRVNQIPPVPSFTTSIIGNTVTVTNTSTNANTYNWSFGNGTTSTAQNPTITYNAKGSYQICLRASNNCFTDSTCNTVVISAIDDVNEAQTFVVYPNPSTGTFFVSPVGNLSADVEMHVYDFTGRLVLYQSFPVNNNGNMAIDLNGMASGVYNLVIKSQNNIVGNSKLVKTY